MCSQFNKLSRQYPLFKASWIMLNKAVTNGMNEEGGEVRLFAEKLDHVEK